MLRRDFLLLAASAPLARLPAPPPAAGADEKYWRELRWHFSIPPNTAYCNTSTLGASPKCVVDAVSNHMRYVEEALVTCDYDPDRPSYLGGYEDEPQLRERLGKLVNASKQEIALTRNATMGMNYIAHGLDLKPGDEVLLTDHEHPGGRTGYDLRRKRDGIVIKEVVLPAPANDPDELVARFAQAIGPKTKVVAVPHITSGFGIVMPVKQIAAIARERGCFVVVDGAQSLGQVPVDVQDLGCDAYFSSPHKWLLAPKGTGMLYLRKEAWSRVWTTLASSEWDLQTDAGRRFSQIGTGNQSLHKGFEAALDFLDRIGHAVIHARIRQLADALRAGLAQIKAATIASPTHPALCAGMTTYSLAGHEARSVVAALWQKDRIMPRAIARGGVRQSLHIYNTLEDVERTLARLRALTSAG